MQNNSQNAKISYENESDSIEESVKGRKIKQIAVCKH